MSDVRPDQGRYLFAVARAIDPSSLAGVQGLRGAPLEVVEEHDLQAVVCSVDLAEFGEDQLKANLEDLGWLEEVARCHHDVVYTVARAGAVAPMRLVTICSDDDSVRARIDGVYQALSEALARVEGRYEWSVKVYALQEEQREPVATAKPASGAAYLQRKREQATQRRTAGDQHLQAADEIHQTLAHTVAATRVLPPQDPRLTGRADTMILNGAYLVPADDADGFQALTARLDELHPTFEFEVKGPWPPYSFATLD
jgi:Gas vesicle synthesis protein GvpL/GvpF